jgi:hypothetical protein
LFPKDREDKYSLGGSHAIEAITKGL